MSGDALPHLVIVLPVCLRPGAGLHVLIAERTRESGGGWFPLSGPVQPRETLADTARRTLAHEAGLIVAGRMHNIDGYLHRMPVPPEDRDRYPRNTKAINEYGFWARLPVDLAPALNPHRYARAAWLPVEHALGRLALAMHARAVRLSAAAWQANVPT